MMDRLSGKVALVTGAAGGIGSATVRRFVAEGARVVGVDIVDLESSATATGLMEEFGSVFEYRRGDVGNPDDVADAVNACVARHGAIDVLFSNAASSTGGYLPDIDLTGWDRSLRVMLSAALYAMQAAIPHMVANGGGSIITTSSVYGLATNPGIAPYATAKAGLINLTRTAAVEYGRKGVRANAICPGVVDTPMFAAVLSSGLTTRDKVAEMHAIGRIIEPQEVANLVLFLASDESSAITGQAIVIDGGLLSGVDLTGAVAVR
jgi:NAD(P)-dependent dehydrogenase (short-subunit alcohol dehydrogenase family)